MRKIIVEVPDECDDDCPAIGRNQLDNWECPFGEELHISDMIEHCLQACRDAEVK